MEQIYLDALRDEAIKYIPRAQKIRDQAKGQSNDSLCLSLYGTMVLILARPATSAIEQAAAHLLQYVMQLSINWDVKLTPAERKRVESYAIEAANVLCTFTREPIPWLPSALTEEPTPEIPAAPTPPAKTEPHIELPLPGTNLTTDQAAQLLNKRPQTLRSWASKDNGPIRPIRSGRHLAWPSDEVRRLMQEGW